MFEFIILFSFLANIILLFCLTIMIKTKHALMKEYENLHHKYLLEGEDGAKHRLLETIKRGAQR